MNDDDCVFCKIIAGDLPSWKVYEDDNTLAFFDLGSANEYHTLVVPKSHHVNMIETPEETLQDIIGTVKKVVTIFNEKLGIENLQIINSCGVEGQQDVLHIHYHVLPRHTGDGNDISWNFHPENREKFDSLLEDLI